ncbi:MAG: ATP-binding protein [Chloroflexi bacterium]|nr:ATP-binding protein [Chloroflexota bacterium]
MFTRTIENNIQNYINGENRKILFVWGPRRAGKTTLLSKISKKQDAPLFNFDFLSDREKFQPRREILRKIAEEHPLILIDEVQSYPESTLSLKLLHDEYKVKIIATGSSELRKKNQEFDSLAGRYEELYCLPFAVEEIDENTPRKSYERDAFAQVLQNEIQLYGAYPEIYTSPESASKKISLLENILESYVLKDIVALYDLKNLKLAKDILTKIALQIGQEVSMREIASSLQANVSTVSNYIEVFIKNYVLIPLPSFKTNVRRAVSENRKLYFFDLGIRNALVKDFRNLDLRPDKGGVFENFIVSELEKKRVIQQLPLSAYFYREYGGKEVDIVLENYNKEYTCYEIKYESKKINRNFPLPHTLKMIDKDNFLDEIKALRG